MDDLITEYSLAMLNRQNLFDARPADATWPDEHKLEITRQQKSSLQEQWHAEEITDTQYFSQLKPAEAEIKRLVNAQQAWAVRQHRRSHRHNDTRAIWDESSLGEKREVLFGLLESVIILPGTKGSHRFDPATVIPVWREPAP